jgi:hypothetical protein
MREHLTTRNVGIGIGALAVACAGFWLRPGKSEITPSTLPSDRVVRASVEDDAEPIGKGPTDTGQEPIAVTKPQRPVVPTKESVRKPSGRPGIDRPKKVDVIVPAG